METWKLVSEYEIEVSDYGNVRSPFTKRWVRPHMSNGYLRVSLRVNGKPLALLVHRLVLRAFIGPCPEKHEVNHINNVKTDNRLSNLEYVTSSQNTLHAVKMGTWAVGEDRWNAKLHECDIPEIERMHREGKNNKEIAEFYHVSPVTIGRVLKGQTYFHRRTKTIA